MSDTKSRNCCLVLVLAWSAGLCVFAAGAVRGQGTPLPELGARAAAIPRVHLPSARTSDSIPGDGAPVAHGARGQLSPRMSVLRQAVGIARAGGDLLGMGPDYEVTFDRRGVTYVPALGDKTPRNLPLRFEPRAFGRGAATRRIEATEPAVEAGERHVVRYRRPDFVERYELRPDGVEQSFAFDALPPGRGDLIVRGRIATELPLARTGDHGELRFEIDGIGGVRIGEVVGIDARGRRAPGALRFSAHDRTLDLVLPAAFVDGAALPLVLDPLIGTTFGPPTGFDDEYPDIAWDETNLVYLAVWQRRFSSSSTGIRGQLIDSVGGLVGPVLGIRLSSFNGMFPRVANVNLRDAFVVVWTENLDIVAASVLASSGAISNAVQVVAGTDLQLNPDVSGEATPADDEAIAVWVNATQSKIQTRQITVASNGALSPFGTVDITTGNFNDTQPAISASGGATGRHLITWSRLFGTTRDIRAAVVDRNLGVLFSLLGVASSPDDEEDPAVDGDGTNWVVAYTTEASPFSGDNDVACRGVSYDPAAGSTYLSASEVIVEGDTNDDEIDPSVAWVDASVLIGYADESGTAGDYDAYVKSVDPFSCVTCEGEFALEVGARNTDSVRIATNGTYEAIIVWGSTDRSTFEGDVVAQAFLEDAGRFVDFGGGCGLGGSAFASCARAGNAGFTLRLQHAAPGAPAWLILSPEPMFVGCGPCAIVPDPFRGFAISVGSTDSRGNATLNAPLAIGLSIEFYMQWLVSRAGGACLGFDLSNALHVLAY